MDEILELTTDGYGDGTTEQGPIEQTVYEGKRLFYSQGFKKGQEKPYYIVVIGFKAGEGYLKTGEGLVYQYSKVPYQQRKEMKERLEKKFKMPVNFLDEPIIHLAA